MDITHPYYIIRTQYVMSINESIRKHPLVACTPYSTTSERARKRRRRRRRRHWCGVLSPSNRRRRLRHLRPSRANAGARRIIRPTFAAQRTSAETPEERDRRRREGKNEEERKWEQEKRRQREEAFRRRYSEPFRSFRACFRLETM